jgi:hypothetical protein
VDGEKAVSESMVERVGKAIADAGTTNEELLFYGYDQRREMYDALARAAIEAMREPTEAMCDEGAKEHRWGYGAYDAEVTWKHMISAALQEQGNEQ